MDLKQIKELMSAMGRAGIKKISIKEKTGYELLLERHEEPSYAYEEPQSRFYATPPHYQAPPSKPLAQEESSFTSKEAQNIVEGKYVTSPMVGTFYTAASPNDPPFVKVGDMANENTVICIIEAMKVMNEVKAGVNGKIAEIYVENAHPVEFGTKIVRIV